MKPDVNSVNTKPPVAYHHGDLRGAVVQLCLEKLQDQEMPELGLRGLARELGVSATALYRHFPSKDDLLNELAAIGMESLRQQQEEFASRAGGGREGFKESGMTYIRWAIANPALFRITFSRLGNIQGEELAQRAENALNQLRNTIMDAGSVQEQGSYPDVAVIKAWSLVHGLAHLVLDGALNISDAEMRDVLSSAFQFPSEKS